jgi:hypothetical protein
LASGGVLIVPLMVAASDAIDHDRGFSRTATLK